MKKYKLKDVFKIEWDVVVVGTGMGGGTSGFGLAKAGRKVLFIETGPLRDDGSTGTQEAAISSNENVKEGYWQTKIHGYTSFGNLKFYPTLGYGVGGSTLLYGAQLERFHKSDFSPKKYHTESKNHNLPENWPISYEELSPFYTQAEKLLNIGGGVDKFQNEEDQAHLIKRDIKKNDKDYIKEVNKCGLDSYISHTIEDIESTCEGCGGMICPNSCNRDIKSLCIIPAIESYDAFILDMCEVQTIIYDGNVATGVNVIHEGNNKKVYGKAIILSAGAIFSPKILLNSKNLMHPEGLGNNADLVGKNLMWHASDFFVLKPKKRMPATTNTKLISCNNYYEYNGQKLGTFQSGGTKIKKNQLESFLLKKSSINVIFYIFKVAFIRKTLSKIVEYFATSFDIYATIVEDLPYLHNKVFLDTKSPSGIGFQYDYSEELAKRNTLFKKLIKKDLSKNFFMLFIPGKNNLNWGHPSGTIRFGTDPANSVLDKNNRIHGMKNIYVVDGSFFPSSAGTNPSLTIAANALRVVPHINKYLEDQ